MKSVHEPWEPVRLAATAVAAAAAAVRSAVQGGPTLQHDSPVSTKSHLCRAQPCLARRKATAIEGRAGSGALDWRCLELGALAKLVNGQEVG